MLRSLEKALEESRREGRERILRDDFAPIDFSSNDYLGLGALPAQLSLSRSSASSSRLISGNLEHINECEELLCHHYRGRSALLFNSGYAANHALFSMLSEKGVNILYDEYIHASIRSSLSRSRGTTWSYKHNDSSDLEAKLNRIKGDTVVVTEGIFSMHGDQPDLNEFCRLKEEYGFVFIVDEAHSTGIFGYDQLGSTEQQGVLSQVDVRIHTFGKALGAEGACIISDCQIRQALINFARPFIYTTAPSPALTELIKLAHRRIRSSSLQRDQLFELIGCWKEFSANIKGVSAAPGPIQYLQIGGNQATLGLAAAFQNKGYDLKAILAPTVPKGEERVRVCLHAFNQANELAEIINIFQYFQDTRSS